jgi:hypothetical protein
VIPTQRLPMAHRLAHSLVLAAVLASGHPRASAQDLVVEASFVGNPRPPEEDQVLRATLRNVGTQRLEIHLPEHHGLVPFPSWELQDERGAVVRPEAPSFQSMWKVGLQGEVLELAPGAEASYETKVRLQPGSWTATCTLSQERAEVPWGKQAFVKEMRPWPTLWTGRVQSQAVRFHVDPFTTPRLTLRLPEKAPVGAPCALECSVLWPAAAGQPPRRTALEVVVGTKAYGSSSARWVWNGERWSPAAVGELGPLPPASDSRWSATLDLAACTYRAERAAREPRELAELFGEGWFYVSVACVDDTGRRLFSAQADGHLTALGAPSQPGLELHVRPSPRGPRHVEIALRNAGSAPHRVPASLAYPRHVAFALRFEGDPKDVHWSVVHDATQGGLDHDTDDPPLAASLPKSLSWSSAAFERDIHQGMCTVLLAPGSELTRTIDLAALIDERRPRFDEPLVVRAIWRQRARGVVDTLAPPMTTGMVSSAELALPRVTR